MDRETCSLGAQGTEGKAAHTWLLSNSEEDTWLPRKSFAHPKINEEFPLE